MPIFLPFLVAASALLALTAGARSGWRTQADVADDEKRKPPPPPTVQGAPGHWFYWYLHYQGRSVPYGAVYMTDQEAFRTEFNTKSEYLGVDPHRYVWTGAQWLRDQRRDPELLASAPIPGANIAGDMTIVYPWASLDDVAPEGPVIVYPWGDPDVAGDSEHHHVTHTLPSVLSSVGAVEVNPPIRGVWTAPGFPKSVTLRGRVFKRAQWKFPKTGVVAQYREAVPVNSHHLLVLGDGTFIIDHYDEANPDAGRAIEHLIKDVLKRYVPPAHLATA